MHACVQEELEKQKQRAARFNSEKPVAVEYKPDEDEAAKVKRAIKYEIKYEPSEAVLMDMGESTGCARSTLSRARHPPLQASSRNARIFLRQPPPCSILVHPDLFEARTEAARDVERRPDTIHLYGVDVMSTNDVLQYFGAFGPTFVEWINDSSCECGGGGA